MDRSDAKITVISRVVVAHIVYKPGTTKNRSPYRSEYIFKNVDLPPPPPPPPYIPYRSPELNETATYGQNFSSFTSGHNFRRRARVVVWSDFEIQRSTEMSCGAVRDHVDDDAFWTLSIMFRIACATCS